MFRFIYILILVLTAIYPVLSHDGFRKLSLEEAETRFFQNNLALLAGKFEIDSKRALVLQAGLYANPTFQVDQHAYNYRTDRFFDTTRDGHTIVQLQQLVLLGGKIDKRIKVAQLNQRVSEEQFFDLLRALQFQLRVSFFELHYRSKMLAFYDQSIEAIGRAVVFADKAYKDRNVLMSEVLRLKALLFFLGNERTDVVIELKKTQANLKVLLNDPELFDKIITPDVVEEQVSFKNLSGISREFVLETAMENRPDLKIAVQELKHAQAFLELQEANAIPDISIGPVFNRNATYVPNYFGVTASVTVPIFDRNQGNIESAEKSIMEKRFNLQNERLKIENDVIVSLETAFEKEKLYRSFENNRLPEDYEKLSGLMLENYKQKYINIIEFADFFETYRNSLIQMIKLQTDRVTALEGLNYSVGKTIISFRPTGDKK